MKVVVRLPRETFGALPRSPIGRSPALVEGWALPRYGWLGRAGLTAREPQLIVDDAFRFGKFEASFDDTLALCVFTHLPLTSSCAVSQK